MKTTDFHKIKTFNESDKNIFVTNSLNTDSSTQKSIEISERIIMDSTSTISAPISYQNENTSTSTSPKFNALLKNNIEKEETTESKSTKIMLTSQINNKTAVDPQISENTNSLTEVTESSTIDKKIEFTKTLNIETTKLKVLKCKLLSMNH
jgi:hypothetical protein